MLPRVSMGKQLGVVRARPRAAALRLVLDAGRGDDDALLWPARLGARRLDLLDDVHALDDLAEDDVLAVEP